MLAWKWIYTNNHTAGRRPCLKPKGHESPNLQRVFSRSGGIFDIDLKEKEIGELQKKTEAPNSGPTMLRRRR